MTDKLIIEMKVFNVGGKKFNLLQMARGFNEFKVNLTLDEMRRLQSRLKGAINEREEDEKVD